MAMSNLQHAIAKNAGPPPGFIMMTNPIQGLLPDYAPQQEEFPTHPQPTHILISNEFPMVQKKPIVHIDGGGP